MYKHQQQPNRCETLHSAHHYQEVDYKISRQETINRQEIEKCENRDKEGWAASKKPTGFHKDVSQGQ